MNQAHSKLQDIADIQAGFSFRKGITQKEDGEFRVIQIQDIGNDGEVLTEDLTRTEADNFKPEHFVQQGDVLFATRGANRRAGFIKEEMPDTIFVAQILSLRNISENIMPAYLAWYLNQTPAQAYFESNASGSLIQNIRIDVLKDLEISIPSLEDQRRILEIHRLRIREKKLVEEIQMKRDQITEQTLMTVIK